jgi:hypothetical protein
VYFKSGRQDWPHQQFALSFKAAYFLTRLDLLHSIHDTTKEGECVWPWFIASCYQQQLLLSTHHKLMMLSTNILACEITSILNSFINSI